MKKKSLEELMLVYAANRQQGNRARNHAVFLAYREQVIELHTNGWKYVDIWRAMREDGIIGFSYFFERMKSDEPLYLKAAVLRY